MCVGLPLCACAYVCMSDRRTSTPHRDSESEGDEVRCKEHGSTGVTVLAFNTRLERTVQRGKCLG